MILGDNETKWRFTFLENGQQAFGRIVWPDVVGVGAVQRAEPVQHGRHHVQQADRRAGDLVAARALRGGRDQQRRPAGRRLPMYLESAVNLAFRKNK